MTTPQPNPTDLSRVILLGNNAGLLGQSSAIIKAVMQERGLTTIALLDDPTMTDERARQERFVRLGDLIFAGASPMALPQHKSAAILCVLNRISLETLQEEPEHFSDKQALLIAGRDPFALLERIEKLGLREKISEIARRQLVIASSYAGVVATGQDTALAVATEAKLGRFNPDSPMAPKLMRGLGLVAEPVLPVLRDSRSKTAAIRERMSEILSEEGAPTGAQLLIDNSVIVREAGRLILMMGISEPHGTAKQLPSPVLP